jgi:hypothetical protein
MKLLTMEERVRVQKIKIGICVVIMGYLIIHHFLTGAPILQ